MRFYLEMRPKKMFELPQKYFSASLSQCFLVFSGSDNIFTVTTLQPLFKIPDLAVSTPPPHQILPARAVGPFPLLPLSIVSVDRSHHIVKFPLLGISSILPGLRSRTCLPYVFM